MKYRNRSNIVQLILNKVGETYFRIRVSFPDFRSVGRQGIFHIRSLINNVHSQGLAYFNSNLSYISGKGKNITETHKIG
jgi:hypothetical protein